MQQPKFVGDRPRYVLSNQTRSTAQQKTIPTKVISPLSQQTKPTTTYRPQLHPRPIAPLVPKSRIVLRGTLDTVLSKSKEFQSKLYFESGSSLASSEPLLRKPPSSTRLVSSLNQLSRMMSTLAQYKTVDLRYQHILSTNSEIDNQTAFHIALLYSRIIDWTNIQVLTFSWTTACRPDFVSKYLQNQNANVTVFDFDCNVLSQFHRQLGNSPNDTQKLQTVFNSLWPKLFTTKSHSAK